MSLRAKATKAGEGDWEIPSCEEPHPAVLVAVVDLGTHQEVFQGQAPKDTHKVYLVWELTGDEVQKNGSRFLMGREFTLSLNEKAGLRKLLSAWLGLTFADGSEFDVADVLGKAGLLTVAHGTTTKGKTFAQVEAVSRPPRGYKIPPPRMTPFTFDLSECDGELPAELDTLPFIFGKKVPDKIKESAEWREAAYQATKGGGGDADEQDAGDDDGPKGDIPF